MSSSPVHIGKKKSARLIRSSCLSEEGLKHTSGAWVVSSFDKCTADISVGAGRATNRMHFDSLGQNISSDKRHSFCSIYLSVISDLIKTRSLHITKRKTLLISYQKNLTTSYQKNLSESSVAVQMQGRCQCHFSGAYHFSPCHGHCAGAGHVSPCPCHCASACPVSPRHFHCAGTHCHSASACHV